MGRHLPVLPLVREPAGLPIAAETEAVVSSAGLRLHTPPMIRAGKDVAAEDANRCPGNDVLRVVLLRFHAGVADEGSQRVRRHAILPSVTIAHELSPAKG